MFFLEQHNFKISNILFGVDVIKKGVVSRIKLNSKSESILNNWFVILEKLTGKIIQKLPTMQTNLKD